MKTLLSCLFAILIAIPSFSQTYQELILDDFMFYLFEPEGEEPYAAVTMTTRSKSEYVIPASVTNDGKIYPVTEIGYRAFFGKTYLTSVTIPNSVTTIRDDAFYGCESLKYISIPNSVTTIGDGAFSFSGLRGLILPPSVTSVGYNICDCVKVAIPSTLDEDVIYAELVITYPVDDNMIADSCVYSSDKSVIYYASTVLSGDYTVPGSVCAIGDNAFAYCNELTSVSLPTSVTTIGKSAFIYCNDLTSVTLPDSVTAIGNSAFSSCKRLTSVNIPNSVTAIEEETFSDCEALASIVIPNSVKTIGLRAFSYCRGIDEFNIPGSVTTIDDEAFIGCGISELILPPSVTSIGRNICHTDKVAIPSTLDADAFDDANVVIYPVDNNLFEDKFIYSSDRSTIYYASNRISGDCIIPSSVNAIGRLAFFKCEAMTTVSIPNSVTTIEDSAFYASGLIELILPPSVTSVGKGICHSVKTAVPSTLGTSAFNYSGIVIYPVDNNLFEDKFIYSSDKSTLYFASAKLSGDFAIPSTVTTIGDNAFLFCGDMTSVTIPGSVTSIGNGTFMGCVGLTSVAIPNSVTAIGNSTFSSCGRLTSVIIANSVTTIGNNAFSYCRALTSVSIPGSVTTIGDNAFSFCEGMTSVSIPGSVTSIGNGTFGNCTSLTSVSLPNSVTTIGEYAFAHCHGLASVTLPDALTDIGFAAFFDCKALISVTIPGFVTTIGDYAFNYCEGLTSVTIPGSVTTMGDEVFSRCGKLSEINYNTISPITADKNIFDDMIYNDATLNIAVGGLDKARKVEPWMYFANIQEKSFDQSGIADVTVDEDNDAPTEYYDLRGVRILNPEPGDLYIVRRGNKITKEIIR